MKIGKIVPCFMEERIHRIVPFDGGLGASDRPKVCDATSLCPWKTAKWKNYGEYFRMFTVKRSGK